MLVRKKRKRKNKDSEKSTNLVAHKRAHALAALGMRNSKLPELNSLVQTASDQVANIGGKGNRVNDILVAVGRF